LHYVVIAVVAMVASSVWFGENVHSIRRLCLVIGLGCALSVVAQARQQRTLLVLVVCLVSCLACWRSYIEWRNV